MIFFLAVFATVIVQRLVELAIARRNAVFLRARGGVEIGAEHYKWIVLLHVLFLLSLFSEATSTSYTLSPLWWLCFGLFLLAQLGRYWCIVSLGRHWNTRIIVLPGAERLQAGPYRFLRHPNYLIVSIELFTLPLTFSAYFTAVLFTLANMWLLLAVRIPSEEKALAMLAQQEQQGVRLPEEEAEQ